MKKLIVALVVLAIILTAGILETVYIDKLFGELDDRLDKIEILIENENAEALPMTHELYDWWEEKREKLELFTFSPDIRAFSVALAEAEGSLDCGDFENALSKCRSLKTMSKNIHRVLDFNVEDII